MTISQYKGLFGVSYKDTCLFLALKGATAYEFQIGTFYWKLVFWRYCGGKLRNILTWGWQQ